PATAPVISSTLTPRSTRSGPCGGTSAPSGPCWARSPTGHGLWALTARKPSVPAQPQLWTASAHFLVVSHAPPPRDRRSTSPPLWRIGGARLVHRWCTARIMPQYGREIRLPWVPTQVAMFFRLVHQVAIEGVRGGGGKRACRRVPPSPLRKEGE